MDTVSKVKLFCEKNDLFSRGERVLLAVSGGPDSVALLGVLHTLREVFSLELGVAHLEHGLRGHDSLADQEFVEALALRHSLPFYTKRVRVADERMRAESLEEAARRLRLRFLIEVRDRERYSSIATGHTADDNVETIVYRLISGTGTAGFSGILPRSGPLIHPLLCVNRQEVLRFLTTAKLEYRVDFTNYDNKITRNRIRHEVLPLFQSINRRFRDHILNLSQLVREDEIYMRKVVERNLIDCENPGVTTGPEQSAEPLTCDTVRVDCERLGRYEIPLRRRLVLRILETLSGKDFPFERLYLAFDVVNRLVRNPGGPNRVLFAGKGLRVRREYGILVFEKRVVGEDAKGYLYNVKRRAGTVAIAEISRNISFEILEAVGFRENGICLDLEKLTFPIQIRNRRDGDRISLKDLGLKKVKTIFINEKVSSGLRNRVPIVVSGEELAGIFSCYYGKSNKVSQSFMVTESTKKVLVCTLE